MADDQKAAAVYVSWSTFKNALDSLSQGIPNRVDRTAFPGMAWGVQSQLFTGMKFLGLLNDDSSPTPALHAVAVLEETARKEKLKGILLERYSDLFALDLMKATPALLDEQMGKSYNVAGSTRVRATRFFLSAVDYVGIPISRLFKPKSGNGAAPTRKRRASARPRQVPEPEDPATGIAGAPTTGTARSVQLKSGGTLTVSASIDFFFLSEEDRVFVFELIDKLKKYEQAQGEGVGSK